MITDLFDKDIIKILTLFSVSPGSRFTRNEIKEKTILNNVPLDKAITILINNNILSRNKRFIGVQFEKDNVMDFIKYARNEHKRFKEIPFKVYYALIDISGDLSKMINISRAYLFGSYSKLIYTEKSDVDIAIVLKTNNKEQIKEIKSKILKAEKKYNKIIELHFFEEKDLKQNDPIIKDILRNGVRLF